MDIVNDNIFAAMRIILPEHRTEMRRMEKLSTARTMPVLSQELLAEWSYTITEAIQEDRSVRVELFGAYENELIEGKPTIQNGKLQIVMNDGTRRTLPHERIVSVTMV